MSMMFKHKRQKHLKPLSKYARKVCDGPVIHASVCVVKPQNNFNSDVTEMTAIDCGQEAASSKKPPCPQTLSPDVGCFVDSPSPRKDHLAREGGQYEGSLFDHIDSPHSSKCEAQSIAASFDLDVDDMLNLSPRGDVCKGVPDCEKRCQANVGNPSPPPPLEQSERQGKQRLATPANATGISLRATTIEEDGDYFSYHAEDPTKSKDLSVSAPQQPRQASCSQLHPDCHVVNLPESFQIQGTSPGQRSSFLASDLEIMSGGPRSELARSPHRVLESPVEELWSVGLPMLQSSLCHSPGVNLTESACQGKCVSEGVMELPKEGGGKTPTSGDTESRLAAKGEGSSHSLDTYLSAVTQHLKAPEANGGVMMELSNLMSRVADQSSGPSPPQWQHPSDLTCRNYRRRFGNLTPPLSLLEWHAKSSKAGKRFAELPAFKRSPVN